MKTQCLRLSLLLVVLFVELVLGAKEGSQKLPRYLMMGLNQIANNSEDQKITSGKTLVQVKSKRHSSGLMAALRNRSKPRIGATGIASIHNYRKPDLVLDKK